MLEKLIENKFKIKILLDNDDSFIESITSEELFQIILTFAKDDDLRPSIDKHADKIFQRCTTDYDMFNCFTVICMKVFKINKENADMFIEQNLKKYLVQKLLPTY